MTVVLWIRPVCGWAKLGYGRDMAESRGNELRSDRRKNNLKSNFHRHG